MKSFLSKFTPLLLPISNNSKIKNQKSKLQIKIQNLKDQGKILFGFAGRFVEEKGFDILLKAMPNIIKNIPNAHFIFAGETNISYEDFYKKNLTGIHLLKKHLTFLGLLDNQQMHEFYKNIELIIIPSRSDCFNLVQAEAMLNKVPSIVSNIPGARFLVKKTGFGRIFQNENPVSLASQVIYAVKHKEEMLKNYPKVFRTLDNQINTKLIKKFIEE
jgi:glycosyltransferase involved in cell wall biosynthesis